MHWSGGGEGREDRNSGQDGDPAKPPQFGLPTPASFLRLLFPPQTFWVGGPSRKLRRKHFPGTLPLQRVWGICTTSLPCSQARPPPPRFFPTKSQDSWSDRWLASSPTNKSHKQTLPRGDIKFTSDFLYIFAQSF